MASKQTTPESSIVTRIFVTIVAAMVIGMGTWVASSTINNTMELIKNTEAVKTNVSLLERLTESVDENTEAIRINREKIEMNSESIRAVDGKVDELKHSNNLK